MRAAKASSLPRSAPKICCTNTVSAQLRLSYPPHHALKAQGDRAEPTFQNLLDMTAGTLPITDMECGDGSPGWTESDWYWQYRYAAVYVLRAFGIASLPLNSHALLLCPQSTTFKRKTNILNSSFSCPTPGICFRTACVYVTRMRFF